MEFAQAMAVLGLDVRERDLDRIRNAYLTAIRATHPDLSSDPDSGPISATIVDAYHHVRSVITVEPPPRPPRRRSVLPASSNGGIGIMIIGDDTLEVGAPLDETFEHLVGVAHQAGEVIFLDRSGPLVQVLITFVGSPPSQLLFDLQGRAVRGTTEISCTIESLDEREPPPISAVVDFITGLMVESMTGRSIR